MKTRSAVVATIAAASLAGTAVGWAADRVGDRTTPTAATSSTATSSPTTAGTTRPVTPTAVPTARAEPVTATTSTRPTVTPSATRPPSLRSATKPPRATSSPTSKPGPVHSASFGLGNLLVANDYLDAGWPAARISSAYEGIGQAAISSCQSRTPDQEEGLKKVFMGVATEDVPVGANQYVMQFRTETDARRSVDHVDEWRTWCPATETSAARMSSVSSSLHQVRLDGGAEGQWWTMKITIDGYTHDELVAVVRNGDRVSVVDAHGRKGSPVLDGATLVRRAAARLG